MKNENLYSIDKLNQYISYLFETIHKKKEEMDQLIKNLQNISKETLRREQNLRTYILHLNVKANNRDYHLIKKEIKHLGLEINSNINCSYRNSKSFILENMQSVNKKNDILLKESFYNHKVLIDNMDRQQANTLMLFNKNIENNNNLKENYYIIKRKCILFQEKVSSMRNFIKTSFEKNTELFYQVYYLNRLIGRVKEKCGLLKEDFYYNLIYGAIIDLNLKNEYVISDANKNKINISINKYDDSKLYNSKTKNLTSHTNNNENSQLSINNKSYKTHQSNQTSNHYTNRSESNTSVIKKSAYNSSLNQNNSSNPAFSINNIKNYTKVKIMNKILSNLLNMLDYKKKINSQTKQKMNHNKNIYLEAVYDIIEKSKNDLITNTEEYVTINSSRNKELRDIINNKVQADGYYFITKQERSVVIDSICSKFNIQ